MKRSIFKIQRSASVRIVLGSLLCATAVCLGVAVAAATICDDLQSEPPGAAGTPYPNMPSIAPMGVRIGRHLEIPESARGPAIDPAKGYRTQALGKGLYLISDNVYQSMFMVYESGVIVVDAPPSFAARIPRAIAEVTDKSVTHVIYSHSHLDHIGGIKQIGGHPTIIAQEETRRLLIRANDPDRPPPTITFRDKCTLALGSQTLELSYHGNAHAPGNIFVYAPAQKTLMVVDIVFPGWMPWRQFALAQDIPAYFSQVGEINRMEWETLVAGHVGRTGTHADVQRQLEFMNDLRSAAREALKTTKPGEGLDSSDLTNPWAMAGNYVDRVVIQCVNKLTPKWSAKLAGYDVFIWDQCYVMEESLRMDEQ